MTTSEMAIHAAQRCLEQSGRSAEEIDLVVLGTFTADLPMPATACQIQDRLGINAPAFDLQAACANNTYHFKGDEGDRLEINSSLGPRTVNTELSLQVHATCT